MTADQFPENGNGNYRLNDRLDECEGLARAFVSSHSDMRKNRLKLLVVIYETALYVTEKGNESSLRKKLSDRGVKTHKDTNAFNLLTQWLAGQNRNRATQWGGTLSYAQKKKVAPDQLSDFIKSEGGIKGCLFKVREEKGVNKRSDDAAPIRIIWQQGTRNKLRKFRRIGQELLLDARVTKQGLMITLLEKRER